MPHDDIPIYAILAATDQSTTLHTYARDWCDEFAEGYRLLSADGLALPDVDVDSPITTDPKAVARGIDVDSRELDWPDDATIYVLADPDWLDQDTHDMFRRSVRTMLDRLSEDVRYPFDALDDQRGPWLTACLDDGEVLPPTRNYSGNRGVESGQRDLDSF